MKKISFFALDMLRKENLAALKGGMSSTNKTCGCICIGPLTPADDDNANESESSDSDCTDCGASNAHRATNEL